MHEGLPIRIPQEFVNDDTVKLIRWVVQDGQSVLEGQIVAEVETSKALVELAAAAPGTIRLCRRPGEDVRVGEIVGYISTNGHSRTAFGEPTTAPSTPEQARKEKENLPSNTRFSKKALELLEASEMSASVFAGRGLVREQDVLQYLEHANNSKNKMASVHFALDKISLERVSLPGSFDKLERGRLNPEFLSQLRNDPSAIARLSPEEKCAAYRLHGALIGEGAVIGGNSIMIAPHIVIGDRVQIGANSSIQCRERFHAGNLTSFRAGLSVRGASVAFGENVFAGGNIQIGGGGSGDPFAVLSVGDGTYIGDDVFINVCRPVLIGKEVFLTQRAILVTHNIGHSILEGYENRFAPIVLEDYSQVGMNSTIYAGSRVGQGSIVMSNSYVLSSIPPGKLAGGVPARVVRDAARPLERTRQLEIVYAMVAEYRDLLALKGHDVSPLNEGQSFRVQHGNQRFQLNFAESSATAETQLEPFDEKILWTFERPSQQPEPGCTIVDLLGKSLVGNGGIFAETTREFLRKRGIRLQPGPWRYAGGLI
jgi:acetyltransferase-like isoleucine patch superfamily enzyme